MGNHTIICPHCGDDQRHTYPCCDAVRREVEARQRAFRAEQAARQALFERHGIEFWVNRNIGEVIPESDSVVRFLRNVEIAELAAP